MKIIFLIAFSITSLSAFAVSLDCNLKCDGVVGNDIKNVKLVFQTTSYGLNIGKAKCYSIYSADVRMLSSQKVYLSIFRDTEIFGNPKREQALIIVPEIVFTEKDDTVLEFQESVSNSGDLTLQLRCKLKKLEINPLAEYF